jgi:hypothetical protein
MGGWDFGHVFRRPYGTLFHCFAENPPVNWRAIVSGPCGTGGAFSCTGGWVEAGDWWRWGNQGPSLRSG